MIFGKHRPWQWYNRTLLRDLEEAAALNQLIGAEWRVEIYHDEGYACRCVRVTHRATDRYAVIGLSNELSAAQGVALAMQEWAEHGAFAE